MATTHPALDAAVQQFAQQPGVSPADVSALHAALSAEPNVSQRLDTHAASGALHGFALAAAGALDRPVGGYDRTAGTTTLPGSAFSGPHPDVGAVLRVKTMVADLAGKTYADAEDSSRPVTPTSSVTCKERLTTRRPWLEKSSGPPRPPTAIPERWLAMTKWVGTITPKTDWSTVSSKTRMHILIH